MPGTGDGAESDAVGLQATDAGRLRRPGGSAAGPAACGVRWRGAGSAGPAPMVRAFRRSSAAPGQHVWDHRDHGPRDLSSAVAGGSRRRGGQSDRRTDPGPVLVSARRRAEPCAQGLHRRAVCGGRGIGAGLSESPRAELHALRGRSVLHDWGTSVPDRRPGPLSLRRGGRVRRSDRPPGQDSRLPHRTGRNRGPPARTAGRGRGGRAASRGGRALRNWSAMS